MFRFFFIERSTLRLGYYSWQELWLPRLTSIKGAQGCPADTDFAG